jgi:xanthine dehydrogenase accessory factor
MSDRSETEVLIAARDASYIGSLGIRKTHTARLRRLGKAGFSKSELQRVNGPVGLPIGSHSPSEIAASVLAEVTQTLRKPSTDRDGA